MQTDETEIYQLYKYTGVNGYQNNTILFAMKVWWTSSDV